MSDEQPLPSRGAHCIHCGEGVALNYAKVGKLSHDGTEILSGWHHHDGMKRDHRAYPHDLRSAEDENTRMTAIMDQAKASVNRTLQANFDELNARDQIDDLFRDRRKS